jgi:flagellar basal-body rod protein FlgB
VTISFDKALGIHADALRFRTARAESLANNLINADTPGFKARDIRFKDMLDRSLASAPLKTTHAGHINRTTRSGSNQQLYRQPMQPSIDGNTVDAEFEESAYMRNAVEFQSSFTFLNGKFRGLLKAIRGE